MPEQSLSTKRVHIYEIDLIRGITVLSVVILHSLATTQFLLTTTDGSYFINLLIHLLHYGRQIFIFITGLVLTYSHFGREFSAKKFWIKRVLLIFIPYVFWSILYVAINNHTVGVGTYFSLLWIDILTGNASYQLYYILLALQLYIIFPLFLPVLKKIIHRPWIVLGGLFLLQIIFEYYDFIYLQIPNNSRSNWIVEFINAFQDRIFLSYLFFFVLGAFAAVYMEKGYQFLKKFGKFLPGVLLITGILYSFYYYQIVHTSQNIFYATSVFQPNVVIYSTVIIIFFCWLATLWAKQLKWYMLVKLISDTSFGIYFVHVFLLAFIVKYLLPFLSEIPIPLQIIFTAGLTFSLSVILCYALLKTPNLGWTIGRGRRKQEV